MVKPLQPPRSDPQCVPVVLRTHLRPDTDTHTIGIEPNPKPTHSIIGRTHTLLDRPFVPVNGRTEMSIMCVVLPPVVPCCRVPPSSHLGPCPPGPPVQSLEVGTENALSWAHCNEPLLFAARAERSTPMGRVVSATLPIDWKCSKHYPSHRGSTY